MSLGFLRFGDYSALRREVFLLIVVNSIFGFAYGFAAPSVAPLIVLIKVTMTFVGNTRAAARGLGTVFRPLLGPLIDRFGAKPFYLVGGALTVAGYASYALTESWSLLGAGLLLSELDFYVRGLARTAAIGSCSDPETRGKAFSLDLGLAEMASAVAPLVGGYVAGSFQLPFRWIFWISTGLTVFSLTLMATKYSSSKMSSASSSISIRGYFRQAFSIDRRLRAIAFVSVLDSVFWSLSFPFYNLFIYKELGATTEQLGIAVAIMSASPAISALTLGPMLDKWRTTRFLAVSEFMALGAILPILVATRPEVAYFASIFWGLVYSLWAPAMNSYMLDTVGPEKFARATGSLSLLTGIFAIPSPAIAGWLYDNVSPKVPFTVTLVAAVVIGALIIVLFRKPRTSVRMNA